MLREIIIGEDGIGCKKNKKCSVQSGLFPVMNVSSQRVLGGPCIDGINVWLRINEKEVRTISIGGCLF